MTTPTPTAEQLETDRRDRVKARLEAAGGLPIHEPVPTGIPPRPKKDADQVEPAKPPELEPKALPT